MGNVLLIFSSTIKILVARAPEVTNRMDPGSFSGVPRVLFQGAPIGVIIDGPANGHTSGLAETVTSIS